MKKLLIGTVLTASVLLANQNTGCGLGSLVIQNQDSVLMQVLATTTNGTSGNQTFGITSGTLNCEKPASFVMNEKLLNFVASNIDSIAIDGAKGSGETLNTLATLMNVQDKAQFSKNIQAKFDTIFTSGNLTSAQLINNISNIAI
jgi:hypothetical protein